MLPTKNKKFIISNIIGICIISVVQLVAYYITLPDFVYGGLIGLGIGIMILGLYLRSIKPIN
jgi:hypothetical protein